jgi:hypothetical protein
MHVKRCRQIQQQQQKQKHHQWLIGVKLTILHHYERAYAIIFMLFGW